MTEPVRLFVVGNTGDDLDWWGLRVSPDLDSVAYALAGLLDGERGWGVHDDTFHCLEAMDRLGRETWFRLSDRDLATHLHRTLLLRAGALTAATRGITEALGVRAHLVPMSDDPVRTSSAPTEGWLGLEEFFVRERCTPDVQDVAYRGADMARGTRCPRAVGSAEAVVVCCSNPVTSIGPILAVPGSSFLRARRTKPRRGREPDRRRASGQRAGREAARGSRTRCLADNARAYCPWPFADAP